MKKSILKEEPVFCHICGVRLFHPELNSFKYKECEDCFWRDGFNSPADRINKKFPPKERLERKTTK